MDFSELERRVLKRFAEKCATIGGPKAGYVLRMGALAVSDDEPFDPQPVVAGLVAKEKLALSEDGDFVYLTESGVETLVGESAI